MFDTPMSTSVRRDNDENGVKANLTMYRGIIRSLIYINVSRPKIVSSVIIYALFEQAPKESLFKAAKRIVKHLKGTEDLVLFYTTGDTFDLIGHVDADYAGFIVDKKSTSDMVHFLGSTFISWGTKK